MLIRSTLTALFALVLSTVNAQFNPNEKELVELRTYEVKTGAKMTVLIDYLNQVLAPTLKEKGAREIALFKEVGDAEPYKLYLMIAHSDSQSFVNSQELHKDSAQAPIRLLASKTPFATA